jgi:hypothetical protein
MGHFTWVRSLLNSGGYTKWPYFGGVPHHKKKKKEKRKKEEERGRRFRKGGKEEFLTYLSWPLMQ